jgi:hypothetical protein
MALFLTALRVLPDPPTLPVEDAPTPYTLDRSNDTNFQTPLATRSSVRSGRVVSKPLVHFDIDGLNKDVIFLVDVLATPSSPLDLLPSLNGLYWDRALSGPSEVDYVSTLLHRSWHPWRCLFLQQAMTDEEATRAAVLGEQSWERWQSARSALSTSAPDFLSAGSTGPPSSEHDTLVSSTSTMRFTTCMGEVATSMALRGFWYGASIVAKHSVPAQSEALFYKRHLAHLRGIVVPEFLGLYRSDDWTLLILEDVDSTIKPTAIPWEGWSEQEKCVSRELAISSCQGIFPL